MLWVRHVFFLLETFSHLLVYLLCDALYHYFKAYLNFLKFPGNVSCYAGGTSSVSSLPFVPKGPILASYGSFLLKTQMQTLLSRD